ncbi:hypothetical protein ACP70R_021516 [Stipagrostis hirtigluma subsp. patula]
MEKLHHSGPYRVAPKIMSLESLKEITDNFSEERKLGSGTFGKVYKGVQNGEEIAVKMLHLMPGIDDLEQFKREFENLWRVRHQNIVQLLGYCYEIRLEYVELGEGKTVFGQNIYRALCFEYMHNGSLQKHLCDEYHGLDWQTRYKIIKGICEGLKYLHEGLDHSIYHMDIKPDNILLDKDMVPKLADFGLSKLVCNDQTQATQSSIGTIGYLPPEYLERNLVSKKLDIFSLGVVMIQIMAGIKGYHKSAYMSSQEFIDLVHENWRNRLEGTLRSTSLEVECHQVRRSIEIAADCVHADRKKRPIIGNIVRWLNETEQMKKMVRIISSRLVNDVQFMPVPAASSVSNLVDDVQLMSVSAAPSPPQHVISVPKGPGETSGTETCSLGSSESIKLLDVYPLELRFPSEPNTRITCPVTLTNRTDHCVGVWITPICQNPCSDLHFLVLWEGKHREVPCSTLYRRVGAHSTLVVQMTLEEKQLPPPPREVGKFEVVMINLGSAHVLVRSDLKVKMNSDFLKSMEESGRKIYRAMLRAVICDPSSRQPAMTHKLVPVTSTQSGYRSFIDVHPTEAWILVGDTKDWVSVWNYQTQERMMVTMITKVDTGGTCSVHSVKFIAGEQWFATGDDDGWVHVYAYTTKEKCNTPCFSRGGARLRRLVRFKKIKEFGAHRGKSIDSLAVDPTGRPFLLTSSPSDTSIKLWDWSQDWKCTQTFDVLSNRGVFHLKWNPGDTNAFSCVSFDRKIKIWNIDCPYPITTLEESDSNDYLFLGGHEPLMVTACYREPSVEGFDSACLWDLQTEKRVHNLGVMGNTSLVACHPTLPLLVTLLESRIVCLWDARTYRLEKMVELPEYQHGMVFTSTTDLIRHID